MNNDVLNIINIDKIIGMGYPNFKASQMAFTIKIQNIETTPTLYKITIEYGVEYYKQATILINRDMGFKTDDDLGYNVELIFIGEIHQNPFQAIFGMSEFSTPTTFLSAIQKFVQNKLNHLPF